MKLQRIFGAFQSFHAALTKEIRGGSRGWPALLGTRSDFCLLVLLLVFGCGPTSVDTVRFVGCDRVRFVGCDRVRFVGWIRPWR